MYTTIQQDNHLHERARQYALMTGKTFAAFDRGFSRYPGLRWRTPF